MVTSLELRAREKALKEEQRRRDEKVRQQKEKERIALEARRAREAQHEENKRREREAEEQRRLELQAQHEVEMEANRGILLHADLQPVDMDVDAYGAARGIRRARDKVMLPASMSNELMNQDAAKNGALLFELTSSATGRRTHVGVLEFTAAEGVIALPRKVQECLFGHGAPITGVVHLKYRRLEKGSFVRFQPLSRGFHEAVGEHVKPILEQALMQYSALTVGDIVRVDALGAEYALKVVELRPEPAVSIIDTDIEAEVVASVETEELIRAFEEEKQRNQDRLRELQRVREEQAQAVADAALREAEEKRQAEAAAAEAAAAAAEARSRALAALEASLPPEPGPEQAQECVTCAFRLPNGQRISRRFLLSNPVESVFRFVDAKGAGGVTGDYALVTQYPRRRILRPGAGHGDLVASDSSSQASATLQSLGFSPGGNELLLLEPLE